MTTGTEIEIWGGVECTINRVGDQYFDQSEYSGHYERGVRDIDLIGSLGIKMLRYPVLWEKHQPVKDGNIDWSFIEKNLNRLRELNIAPIAGLVHHGSGPRHVNFYDGSFEEGLAEYAKMVIQKFPWLEYFTPVNEPLTTARFCGLYGHWYPHGNSDYHFYKVLVSECKATVMAMKAIRQYRPDAKLIQTEDLGKTYSTPLLSYQAEFENNRRWLSYDLMCGKVNPDHFMWHYMVEAGIGEDELLYFIDNNCVPHIAGFNFYITSERYLDHNVNEYPQQYHGGNCSHRYADIEIVKVHMKEENGPALLLREAWQHLQLPLAITECHLHSTREDQMRWFNVMWKTLNKVKHEGVDIRAITAWAIFGLTGWNRLVTQPGGDYEPGVFNVSSGCPKPTALARFIQELTHHKVYYHPVLENEGWWQRSNRQQFGSNKVVQMKRKKPSGSCRPLLILGRTGTLGKAFSRICDHRNIHHLVLNASDINITDTKATEQIIKELQPWGIVNAAGYEKVNEAELESDACFDANCDGPAALAKLTAKYSVRFLTFSTDLVFDGNKNEPYTESDGPHPINTYGLSKAIGEKKILAENPEALIIRTGSLFGPWDKGNFVSRTLANLKEGRITTAASDVYLSPTYIPDLVHESLNLLLDGDTGIVHVTNGGQANWADLAKQVAILGGFETSLVEPVRQHKIQAAAMLPHYTVLKSEKGIILPSWEFALQRYFEDSGFNYQFSRIAV